MPATPDIKFYTANYYTVTGEMVYFENLCSNLSDTAELNIQIDDKSFVLSSPEITNSFALSFDTLGAKDLVITPTVTYTPGPTATVFESIVYVLPQYDFVSPVNYITVNTPLELPWPECPQVGLNDFGVADNINNCLEKIYDNLAYLKQRASIYTTSTTKFYGQLSALSAAPLSGIWVVPINGIDTNYNIFDTIDPQNTYTGIAAKENFVYIAQQTAVTILSSGLNANRITTNSRINSLYSFRDIKNICLNSRDHIYVLDGSIPQVVVFAYEKSIFNTTWELVNNWGKLGAAGTKDGFLNPNDIHIDQFDNVWICDTGNKVIKQYTSSGTWLNTIFNDNFNSNPPLSLCVDSQSNVHVLTNDKILVFTYSGEYTFSYEYKNLISSTHLPRRINTSYNREMIYLATNKIVYHFFRTGVFAGSIMNSYSNITNITHVSQDEFRNLYVISDDKLFKIADIMALKPLCDPLPSYYWTIDQIKIRENEYVQSWVYNSAFQKLWDNIEILRNCLYYTQPDSINQRGYKPPTYSKTDIIIGQNELVTAAVVNRALNYLCTNLNSVAAFVATPENISNFDTTDIITEFEEGTIPDPVPPKPEPTPACYGKYGVVWSWKSLKCSSSTPITWEQTKLGNIYSKKWEFEIIT